MVNRAFQLTKTVVLARLLAPQDFGLFGTALLTLSILDAVSQPGFWQALIQKKVDVRPYLNTVWTVGVIRSILIAAALYGASPVVAGFFNVPAAVPIFRIIGLSIVFQNLINIGVIFFEKDLEFHKYFFFQLAGTAGDMIVSISAALLLRSVWALVLGRLAGNIVSCIVSYAILPWRPRLSLNLA
jgi:O-antigen/teichoic acid export membrane protein